MGEIFSKEVPQLLQAHLEHLLKSSISIEVIRERGYKTVMGKAELAQAGFSKEQQRVPGILIPLFAPDGIAIEPQYRPDNPREDGKGKKKKYENVPGKSMRLDCPPRCVKNGRDPNAECWITEGAKKADSLVAHGAPFVINVRGVNNFKGKNEFQAPTFLADFDLVAWHSKDSEGNISPRTVYIVYDSDIITKPQVNRALLLLKAQLDHKKAKVLIVRLPDEAGKKMGADDYLAAEHTLDDLRALATDEVPEASQQSLTLNKDGLPDLIVSGRHLRDKTGEALAALCKKNNPPVLFRRNNIIIRIAYDEKNCPYTEMVNESTFRAYLERSCNFVTQTLKGNTPVSPPLDIVRDALVPGNAKLPPLLAITESPVIRPDGSILNTPGYDAMTSLYYQPAPNLHVTDIPDKPLERDVDGAVELLMDIVADFPFDTEPSYANTLAAFITPIIRPMIDGSIPLFIFDKPQSGTGASLLSEVLSVIATGRPAAMMTTQRDDDGWRKAITSVLIKGCLVAVIDNVEGTLYAPSLGAVLTATNWQDRILGRSELISLPNRVIWIVTGNNIKLGGDLPRRCVWARLDAEMARPWLRDMQDFKHPQLIKWVSESRGKILAAILTIARAWVIAGRPRPQNMPTVGGFEGWCEVVGGILQFVGMKGFLGNLHKMYDEVDTETPQWESFLYAWHDLTNEPQTAVQLAEELRKNDEFRATLPDVVADTEKRNFARRLGNALAKKRGIRYPCGLSVVKAGEAKRSAMWKVISSKKPSFADLASEPPNLATDSPNLASKVSLGESAITPRVEGNSGEDIENKEDIYRVKPDSPDSLIASKMGEPAPDRTCYSCGSTLWWQRDGEWICSRCHPKP